MKHLYTVSAEFRIEAASTDEAENIVQNAVEGTSAHLETAYVTAEADDEDDTLQDANDSDLDVLTEQDDDSV
jgi:hypothetical protein